jgi:hypothetical protein
MVYNIIVDINENKPIINKPPETTFDNLNGVLKPSFVVFILFILFIFVYNKYI